MRKCILILICLCLLGCSFLPLAASAQVPLEEDREASLTLYFTQEGVGFAGLEISLYRVARAFSNGDFQLILPYSTYPIDIYHVSSQKEWKDISTTLTSYIAANQNTADAVAKTDDNGTVVFAGLETGLYYVSGVTVEKDSGTYVFDPFMIYLPTPQDDGTYDYDMEAKPKCGQFVPKTEYSVTKLWKDGSSDSRPEAVTVEIRKDGVLQETRVLSNENNWSYRWSASEADTGKWTVNEAGVSEGYTVSVSHQEGKFILINTASTPGEEDPEETEPTETDPTETTAPKPKPSEPPKTGDSFALIPWTMAMCISGFLLLILGIYTRRHR